MARTWLRMKSMATSVETQGGDHQPDQEQVPAVGEGAVARRDDIQHALPQPDELPSCRPLPSVKEHEVRPNRVL